MPAFFPVRTANFKIDETRAFRRFSYSVVEMAIVTAVVLRVYRALALSLAGANVFLLGLSLAFGFVVLFGMVTLLLTQTRPAPGRACGVSSPSVTRVICTTAASTNAKTTIDVSRQVKMLPTMPGQSAKMARADPSGSR